MNLAGSDLPLVNRQRLSARRTHDLRRNKTEAAINHAILSLIKADLPITATAIAKAARITRQTIARTYRHLLTEAALTQLRAVAEAAPASSSGNTAPCSATALKPMSAYPKPTLIHQEPHQPHGP
jgi:hypothetical protein